MEMKRHQIGIRDGDHTGNRRGGQERERMFFISILMSGEHFSFEPNVIPSPSFSYPSHYAIAIEMKEEKQWSKMIPFHPYSIGHH